MIGSPGPYDGGTPVDADEAESTALASPAAPAAGSTTLYRAGPRRVRRFHRRLLAVLALLVAAVLAGIAWLVYQGTQGPLKVPAQYASVVSSAASTCGQVTVALLAAQLDAESGWNPQADSGHAQGIAQFTPATWSEWGGDYDHSGSSSVWDPGDAIPAQAKYMCSLFKQTANVPGDATANALAAYNAGPTAVINAGGVPNFPETQAYVSRIEKQLEPRYQQGLNQSG
ncbi:soluble lytic murein transglycosylase-like protein [Streptacidiphilus sp. MAP12-16]|uniref:lytic transglycosylase domain-containing protein n=1 Tax=Streptacidiphilus sp. MAP12-16 TaxID=3156300 RepID=UPI0035110F28